MSKKQALGIGISAVIILISQFLPASGSLSSTGIRTIGMLVAFLVMLVTEALPVVVTSLLFCGLMPLLGVTENLGEALTGYAQPIVFFTLASFGIAAAITSIPLAKRILRALMRKFGKNIATVLLAVMVCTALVSSMVSNVPTCAIFMAIALSFVEMYKDKEEKRKTARAFMIAVPIASMIGGMMTPAGSSINLLAIAQLEKLTGETITFVQWMLAGIPLAIVMIPLAWFLILKIYKPVSVSHREIEDFVNNLDVPDQMEKPEIKVVWLIIVMLVLWILSSWVKSINVMVVAIIGCCVLFFPGMRILKIETFLKENSWDAFFLVGTVLSISEAMITNGVSSALANALPTLNVSTPLLLGFTALLIFAALLIIPVASSLIPIMAVPLVAIATGAGVNPALVLMSAALCACNCYLLPLDTVTLITYAKGYYSMTDLAKCTIFLQLAMILLCALWVPIAGLLGGM